MRFGGLDPSDADYYDAEVALNKILQILGGPLGVTTNATVTQIADTNVSTQLFAANSDRVGIKIYNDSTAILYVLFGSGTASSTNYSLQVKPQQLHEDKGGGIYKGVINGIWASNASGNAYVTEW